MLESFTFVLFRHHNPQVKLLVTDRRVNVDRGSSVPHPTTPDYVGAQPSLYDLLILRPPLPGISFTRSCPFYLSFQSDPTFIPILSSQCHNKEETFPHYGSIGFQILSVLDGYGRLQRGHPARKLGAMRKSLNEWNKRGPRNVANTIEEIQKNLEGRRRKNIINDLSDGDRCGLELENIFDITTLYFQRLLREDSATGAYNTEGPPRFNGFFRRKMTTLWLPLQRMKYNGQSFKQKKGRHLVRMAFNNEFCQEHWKVVKLNISRADDDGRRNIEEIRQNVRQMVECCDEPVAQMELVDDLQRLGVPYHFEKELKVVMDSVFEDRSEGP
ncbi:putative terpene synthase 2 [Nymphaea thermarum]|nr:putative terpene synthase 2 [Nymphaea thermarum]